MDLLNAMRNFTAVVDAGGFSQAAIRLRISKATISQSVKNLEDHLQVRLFNRNTRHVKLTEEGIEYNERCRSMLEEIDEIQRSLVKKKLEAEGRLCIEIPYALGKSHIPAASRPSLRKPIRAWRPRCFSIQAPAG